MWRRFTSTLVDIPQQPLGFPESILTPKTCLSKLVFYRKELDVFSWLFSKTPCFSVKANKVSILHGPEEFYETLMEKCHNATNRIVLASLYLGTGSLEKNLVSSIKENESFVRGRLKLSVLLDFQRGSRGSLNSKIMLQPLLDNTKSLCRISFYHTPQLRGFYKNWVPERWNELIGVQHMKVYLTDDTVIFSGANLSHDYFTNRQDRYIMIEDKKLADFYDNLVSVIQSISFHLQKDGSVYLDKDALNPYEDDLSEFINNAHKKITQFYNDSIEQQSLELQNHTDNMDTWVLPLLQAGSLGIFTDSEMTTNLFATAPSSATIKIATGYFNLTKEYTNAIVNDCQADCSMLMAHPNANGFQGAAGAAGIIPDAYSLLAQKFYNTAIAFKQRHRITLYEYEKEGWTFHGKGLWYYLPGDSLPCLTFIGSPNFGERSVYRDIESQVAIVTANDDLKKSLHQESILLYQYSRESVQELYERVIPKRVKLIVAFMRNYF